MMSESLLASGIKAPGEPFDGTSVYTFSIEKICSYFEHYLATTESVGFCIADSRSKPQNSKVSHSIFLKKFGTANFCDHLIELPTFGHSENHAGLQICDIVCSALLYPIACFAYSLGMWTTSMCKLAQTVSETATVNSLRLSSTGTGIR